MSPKDYVARERVPPKTTTKSRTSKPRSTKSTTEAPATKKATPRASTKKMPEPKGVAIPKVRIAFTFIVLVGFVVFLWNIKDSSENRKAELAQQQEAGSLNEVSDHSVDASKHTAKQDDLPELKEEEWEFMETLTDPDYEVKVELPKDVPKSEQTFILQCGSFRQMHQAEQMRARIAFQGLESQIKESNGSNGLWCRVVLGPFERKRLAEKDKHTLQRAGFTTCKIF